MLREKAVELVSVMGGLLIQEQDTVVENDQAWQLLQSANPTSRKRRIELCLESSQACKIKRYCFSQ